VQLYSSVARVLIIEDEVGLRNNIEELLLEDGYEVQAAANGEVGIQCALEWLPDLILCDIMMPGMDGYTVVRKLQTEPSVQAIPVVFVTAKGTRDDVRSGLDLGVNDYLIKPFTADSLLHVVRTRIHQRKVIADQVSSRSKQFEMDLARFFPPKPLRLLRLTAGLANVISDCVETLAPEDLRRMTTEIANATWGIRRLIENIAIFVDLNTGHKNGRPQDTLEPYSLCGFVTPILKEVAANHGRQPDMYIDIDDLEVRFPPEWIRKILVEITDNALSYSRQGAPVSVRGKRTGSTYSIHVSDKGVGMSDVNLNRIWSDPLQTTVSLKESLDHGLGLRVARALAMDLGTDLVIEENQERGTVVSFELPIKA